MQKFSVFLFLIIICFNAYANEKYNAVKAYVYNLSDEVSKVLNDKSLSEEKKIIESRELIAANTDLEWMAKYTLGRYRGKLEAEEMQEFSRVYAAYVVKAYSNLVKSYKGEHADIKIIKPISDNEFFVETELISKNGNPPIKVEYFVRDISTTATLNLKIVDIITEGVSMINSQQSEFGGIIANGGIKALIEALKKKT